MSSSPLLLGIDTGGTYTDAVLYDAETATVIETAKALTTRHDLAEGIAGAAGRVIAGASADPARIAMVSLSTTLATNALVEGQGGRAALVMIGFGPDDLKRDGLADALGNDPVIFLPGGHDVHGRETPLDTGALEEALDGLAQTVSAVAVAGYFAVRNPSHEERVRDLVAQRTGLPVTCSHELTSKLGGPRRALTTLLNARLIGMIARLINAARGWLQEQGINAPMMVVRGDGALISAEEALSRPIETILSGPAASLVGARHLTGLDNAVVSDIGGTTTDVAVLENGMPRLDSEGATVGAWRTMVEAVAMHTFGLGGDSEVRLEESGLTPRLMLGPRRLQPLSLAAARHPGPVLEALERQVKSPHPGRLDGRFAERTGLPDFLAAGLAPKEAALYARLTREPVPLDKLFVSQAERATLDRLTARGLVLVSGLTPSDAMHVLGRQSQWNTDAARLGALLFSRRKDGAGRMLADTPEDMAERISAALTRQSAAVILQALAAEDGLDGFDPEKNPAVSRALERATGTIRFALTLDRPLIPLGASAPVHYPAVGERLSVECVIPGHAGVANALGAVVGRISETVTVFVTEPEEGRFALNGAGANRLLRDREEAFAMARDLAAQEASSRARANGAAGLAVTSHEEIDMPVVEGLEKLIEARFSATASGRPRILSG